MVFLFIAAVVYFYVKYKEKIAHQQKEELRKKIEEAISEVETQKIEIVKQNEELQVRQQEDVQRRWFNEGLALFSDILRNNKESIKNLADEVLSNLVRYIGAAQGGIFVINDDNDNDLHLQLIASYAFSSEKMDMTRIEVGETLVGNCYIEMKTKYMTVFPDNYLSIESGLGKSNPKSLLFIPLKLDELIFG
ncbi:MAG: GAF domain-containing protein [Bacteroidales bacterium]|nr:GAF domain-containing protein [Bacteroidales bacterium]